MSRFSFSHVFWIRILSVIEFPKVTFLDLFSCGQLNRWHCHSLTDWVIESVSHFLILEHMTYHWMSESYQGDFLWQFWTILKNVDNFDNFWKCWTFWQFGQFWTILTFFDNFDNFENFDNFWQFWQFLILFNNFDNFWHFLTILKILDNFWQFWTIFLDSICNSCDVWIELQGAPGKRRWRMLEEL